MNVLSARYATPVLVALAIALVPTVVNSYIGRRIVETPALTDVVPTALDGASSTPTARKATSIKKEFDSEDWVERRYVGAGGASMTLLAARTYDMKRVYHHPELAVSDADYAEHRVISIDSPRGALDVHVLAGERGNGLAAYALLYKGRTVANPLAFQLWAAPELLLTGSRPMTLVFAEESGYRSSTPVEQSLAVRGVVAAVTAIVP